MRNEKYLLSLQTNMHYTLNCNGQLLDLSTPQVMGILNATPDSFYAASRTQTEREIALRAEEILQQGGTIIDVGACSTRPDSMTATEAEEAERLQLALKTIRNVAPHAIVSVDTFRPQLARMAVEEFGAAIMVEENYEVMNGMERLQMLHLPILVALSRKSMIYRLLGTSQEEALTGTIALNTIALIKGADILRVHDVREAVECVKIVAALGGDGITVYKKQ